MGAAPRKRHGQHFLLDDNLLAAMVRDSGCQAGETVLEIGPGPGLLTRHLLHAGLAVVAVEIDPAMTRVAQDLIEPALRERLTWVEADALGGGRQLSAALAEVLPTCRRFVANLPYGISGPLLGALLTRDDAPPSWTVMLQREMGERLLACAGTRDYGPLSVLAATVGEGRLARRVPRESFWPRPDVESVVVRFEARAERPGQAELEDLSRFLAAAFHTRRKTLVNSLADAWKTTSAQILSSLNLENSGKGLRAEAIPPVKLCALARDWACNAQGGRHRR